MILCLCGCRRAGGGTGIDATGCLYGKSPVLIIRVLVAVRQAACGRYPAWRHADTDTSVLMVLMISYHQLGGNIRKCFILLNKWQITRAEYREFVVASSVK